MDSIKIDKIKEIKILKKCASLLKEVYNSDPWNDEWTKEKAHEKLFCFYSSPKFHGWTAMQGDEILGCCIGNIEPDFSGDYFNLKEIFVSVKFQRKGIGALLLRATKKYLKTIDINNVILVTSQEEFPIEFYQKYNFEVMKDLRVMKCQN